VILQKDVLELVGNLGPYSGPNTPAVGLADGFANTEAGTEVGTYRIGKKGSLMQLIPLLY
jgi:hypothetical protein